MFHYPHVGILLLRVAFPLPGGMVEPITMETSAERDLRGTQLASATNAF